MYQQYRKIENGNILELIEISAIIQEDLDKLVDKKKKEGLELEEILSKFIFKDWKNGDILWINNCSVSRPILDDGKVREMTKLEICESGDLSILEPGEVYQDGKIIKKEKPDGVKIEWQYPNWVETATQDEIDLDAINKMYDEYKTMDFPSAVKEMELQDPAMSEEFLNMLIQLRGMASQITLGIRTMSLLPQPSKELIAFKNRFNQNK